MRNQNKILTVSTLMVASNLGCGDQVAYDSGTGGSSSSGIVQTMGGSSSGGIVGATGGGGGTGGSSLPDTTYCNGLPVQIMGATCGTFHSDTTVGKIPCTITLPNAPTNLNRTALAIDCSWVSVVPDNQTDAGEPDGFTIHYFVDSANLLQANLVLLGSICYLVQTPGYHTLDLTDGCGDPI